MAGMVTWVAMVAMVAGTVARVTTGKVVGLDLSQAGMVDGVVPAVKVTASGMAVQVAEAARPGVGQRHREAEAQCR